MHSYFAASYSKTRASSVVTFTRGTAVACAVLCTPATAFAHGQIPGVGDVLNGMLHPLITPAHVLVLLSLGLYLGQQTTLSLKPIMLAFGLSVAAGMAVASVNGYGELFPPILLVNSMIVAALVALQMPAALWLRVLISSVIGVTLGLDSAQELGTTSTMVKSSLGTWISLVVIVSDIGFYVFLAQAKWLRIGIRVLASWVFAISILVIAFYFRPAKPSPDTVVPPPTTAK